VYERFVVPVVGRILAGDGPAYRYLGRSIVGFGTADAFEEEMRQVGWEPISTRWLPGGSVMLFRAE